MMSTGPLQFTSVVESEESNDNSDLEVATVLAKGFVNEGSVNVTNASRCSVSPHRASTVMTNVSRGNTATMTPSVAQRAHQMAAQGELVLLKEMIHHQDVDINEKDERGLTPLMWACAHGQREVVVFALARGAEAETRGVQGETSLMLASSVGQCHIIRLLLEVDVDTDIQCQNGNCALHYAVYGKHADCVRLLLQWGANMTLENEYGTTPTELAVMLGYRDVQDVIEDYMAGLLEGS